MIADPTPEHPTPPLAPKVPHVVTLHGDLMADDYFWLREKSNPAVKAYLEAENAYADVIMEPTAAFQERLYREMLGRIQETDLSVPYRKGDHLYYSRTEEGKQYPILCRKGRKRGAAEEVVLDLNELARGHSFLGLGAFAVSDDGNLLAYSLDVVGFRDYTLHVKDLRTGSLGPETIERVDSVAWAADNRTLFCVTTDSAKRPYRLFRHRVGTGSEDELVLEEKDERFRLSIERSRSMAYLFAASESLTTSEVRYLAAGTPGESFRILSAREADHEYEVEHRGDLFYIRTNDRGRNFRLVTAPVADPGRAGWTERIPHRPDVMLTGIDLFVGHDVVREMRGGLPVLRIVDGATGRQTEVTFPEPAYSVFPDTNAEFDTHAYRFRYQSPTTPPSVFDYDMRRHRRKLLKETPVLGGYDRRRYVVERIWARAADGARIPISLAYRKRIPKNGSAPMLLTGYGAYGFPLPASFSSNRLSLLDRGVVVALAHVRGGGEMGKAWHDQGRLMQKRNSFTDFIAAAEHLIASNFTSADRLVIEGGSAGGLLVGAVTQMRPDLFRAVVTRVPFVDVINTMLDGSLPLTVGEYEEWGNPNARADYEYIKSYCPYTNLEAKPYPAMLVKTSLNDSQVMYWEPAKYVAKMRALRTDSNLLLLKTNMSGGHGGASGRYDALRDLAFDYAFILDQLGIRE